MSNMRIKNVVIMMLVMFATSMNVSAQGVWKQLVGGFMQGVSQGVEIATLEKIVKNPSLQSADMKNFLNCYRNGEAYMSNGNYAMAAESYAGAWNIASTSNDVYLKKLWTDYDWAKITSTQMNKARQLAGTSVNYSNGGYGVGDVYDTPNSYSSGSQSSSSSSSSSSRVCRLCKGTGLKIKEYYSAGQRKYCSTCGKEVGTGHTHVVCDLCNGTGRLNY